MKIIFLDIDGVLNSERWFKKIYGEGLVISHREENNLDPEAVKILLTILEQTNAFIVISSAWRIGRTVDDLRNILEPYGIPRDKIIDKTVSLHKQRGYEIGEWLSRHEVADFVILDDSSDMAGHMKKLVRTSFEKGLTTLEAVKVINRLNGHIP